MDRFFGFTDSIVNKTSKSLVKMGPEATVQDSMSMVAVDLFSSPSLNENIILRNEIQKEIGPLPPLL